nr:MAG: glycoprotein [Culex hudovirus]
MDSVDVEIDLRGRDIQHSEGGSAKFWACSVDFWFLYCDDMDNNRADKRGTGEDCEKSGIKKLDKFALKALLTMAFLCLLLGQVRPTLADNDVTYFNGSNVSIVLNNDIDVNGTFNLINYNDFGNSNAIWEKMKSSARSALGLGKSQGSFSGNFSLGGLVSEEESVDEGESSLKSKKLIDKPGYVVDNVIRDLVSLPTTATAPKVVFKPPMKSLTTTSTTIRPTTQKVTTRRSIAMNNSIKSNSKEKLAVVKPPAPKSAPDAIKPKGSLFMSDGNTGTVTTDVSYGTKDAHIQKSVVNCMDIVHFLKVEHYDSVQSFFYENFLVTSKKEGIKRAEVLDIVDATLLELCDEDETYFDPRWAVNTLEIAYGVVSKGVGLFRNSSNDIISLLTDKTVDVALNNSAILINKLYDMTKDKVDSAKGYIKEVTKTSKPKYYHNVGRRSLLSLPMEEEDDDDGGFETAGLSAMIKKKTRTAKQRLRSHDVPVSKILKSPTLGGKKLVRGALTGVEASGLVSELIKEGKRIVIREFITSKSAQLIRVRISDSDSLETDVYHQLLSVSRIIKLPACASSLPYMSSMVDPCVIGYSFLQSVGMTLCTDSAICDSGHQLNKDLTCSVSSCENLNLIVNYRSISFLNGTQSVWNSSNGVISMPRSGSYELCSVNGIDVRDDNKCDKPTANRISEFTMIDFIKLKNGSQLIGTPDKYFLQPGLGGDIRRSFNCEPESECDECYTGAKACSGDNTFCKKEGVLCSLDSECSCRMNKYAESRVLKKENGQESIDGVESEVDSVLSIWTMVELKGGERSPILRKVHSCKLSSGCDFGKILAISACDIRVVKVSIVNRELWAAPTKINSKSVEIAIPWDLVLEENKYTVTAYFTNESEVPSHANAICKPFRVCQKITCVCCKEYIRSVRCWGTLTIIMVTLMIPLIILLMLYLLSLLLLKLGFVRGTIRRVIKIIWYLFCPFNLVFLLLLRMLRKSGKATINTHSRLKKYHDNLHKEELGPYMDWGSSTVGPVKINLDERDKSVLLRVDENKNEAPPDTPMIRRAPPIQSRRLPYHLRMFNNSIMITSCVMTLCFIMSEACSDSKITMISSSSCSAGEKGNECELTVNSELILSGLKQTLCFVAKNEGSGAVEMYVIMKVDSLRLECLQSSMYYTFSPRFNSLTHSNCYGRDYCSKGPEESCKKFLNSENTPNEMFPTHIGKLKKKVCLASVGCAGNGCFFCSDGCSFGSISLENSNQESFQVFHCSSWSYKVKLSVKVRASGVDSLSTVTLEDSVGKMLDGMTLTLKSLTTPPTSVFNKCFMRKTGMVSLVECQSEKELTTGRIGEIRCPTLSDSLSPGLKCQFAEGVLETTKLGWNWFARLNIINITKSFEEGLLPRNYGGFMVQSEGDEVFLSAPPNSILSINLKMKKYKLMMKETHESCYIINARIKGCFSCSEGANLTIGVSDNPPLKPDTNIISQIHCPESNIATIIMVTDGRTTFSSIIHTNIQEINEYCNFTCGKTSQRILITASLEEKMEVDPREISSFSSDGSKSSDNGDDFGLILDLWKNAKFRLYLGVSFGVIAFAILLGMTFLILYRQFNVRRLNIVKDR